MPIPTKKSTKEKDYLKKIYLIYGEPKVGKTTTVANLGDDDKNKIMFFPTEPGHKFQEIYKWQYVDPQTNELKDPNSWSHFIQACREITKDDGGFRCIAVDTLDNLWKWCSIYTCKKKGIEHESELGFGKGYHAVRDEFFKPINWLAQNGYGLIFLSHESTSERTIGPRKINYTDTTLPGTCRKLVHGICDYILYFGLTHDGKRFIRTKGTENINAGDRSGLLPELVDMDGNRLRELLIQTAGDKVINEKAPEKVERPRPAPRSHTLPEETKVSRPSNPAVGIENDNTL